MLAKYGLYIVVTHEAKCAGSIGVKVVPWVDHASHAVVQVQLELDLALGGTTIRARRTATGLPGLSVLVSLMSFGKPGKHDINLAKRLPLHDGEERFDAVDVMPLEEAHRLLA